MKIRETFDKSKDINRRIEKVITYAASDPKRLASEISEYVVTERIESNFNELLDKMSSSMDSGTVNEIGVWVSGFYGSGKSSFSKYLAFALDNEKQIDGTPFVDLLSNQLQQKPTRQLLNKLASNFPAAVVPIDLATDQIAGATMEEISTVIYYNTLSHIGYSSAEKKVAYLELRLDRDGKYEEFKKAAQEILDAPWSEAQNDPMAGLSVASQLAPVFYPKLFKDEESFQNLNIEEVTSEKDRVESMLEILKKKTGKKYVIFVLDEVGNYVASRKNLITNLEGLAKNLKEVGKSKAWIIATAQQTLTEDNPRAQLNSPQLYQLEARFPIQIDLEAEDIKEICIRRLLGKSTSGESQIGELFDAHGQKLRLSTKLEDTSYYDSDFDKTTFVNLYPFLPHHFQILLELLGRLAKSSGGIGLRSAIKIIQDVLIDKTSLGEGGIALADQEIGTLANTVTLYDGLRKEVERSFRAVVNSVSKTETSFGKDSTHAQVAKSIAILQILDNLPATQKNIAALMQPSVTDDSLFDQVGDALREIIAEQAIPLSLKDNQYRFLSDAILSIEQERRMVTVPESERKNALNGQIRELFTPKPTASIDGERRVPSGLRTLIGSSNSPLEGEREAAHFVLSLVEPADYDAQIEQLLNDSCQRANDRFIYVVAKKPQGLDEKIIDAKQCEKTHRTHRHSIEPDVRDFAESLNQNASNVLNEVLRSMKSSLANGSFIFRGQRTAVSERDTEFNPACQKELKEAAEVILEKYKLAPVRVGSEQPESFLRADLHQMTSRLDPLGLIKQESGSPIVKTEDSALSEIVEFLESRGDQLGKSLLDHFSEPPYGWAKDTTRYLVAALIHAGLLKFRVSGEETFVQGDLACSGIKTNQIFNKTGVGLRETKPDPEALLRARQRLIDLTGDQVMPSEKSISTSVMAHFPDLQTEYNSLDGDLRELGLSGSDRVYAISQAISGLIKGDGSSAPQQLGLVECPLIDDLNWAQAVRDALKAGLKNILQSLNILGQGVENLPNSGIPGNVKTQSEEVLQEIESLKGSEEFYKQSSRFKELHDQLEKLGSQGTSDLMADHVKIKKDALDSLQKSSTWRNLDDDTREQINKDFENISVEVDADLAGLKKLVDHEYDMNTRLRQIKDQAESISKEKVKAKEGSIHPMPVPRRFDTEDQVDELIKRLQGMKDKLPADVDWKF